MVSEDKCPDCGASTFGLTARFREFVGAYSDLPDEEVRSYANRLYELRSGTAHRLELLRADEYDSGFSAGGRDSEHELSRGIFAFTRQVLRNWLKEGPVVSDR